MNHPTFRHLALASDAALILRVALLVLVCTVLVIVFYILIVERFLRPMFQGMREAEREYRVRRGRCVECGYDLRASTATCPECGAAFTRKPL